MYEITREAYISFLIFYDFFDDFIDFILENNFTLKFGRIFVYISNEIIPVYLIFEIKSSSVFRRRFWMLRSDILFCILEFHTGELN